MTEEQYLNIICELCNKNTMKQLANNKDYVSSVLNSALLKTLQKKEFKILSDFVSKNMNVSSDISEEFFRMLVNYSDEIKNIYFCLGATVYSNIN